jgi:hypothetical protein
LPSRSSAAQTTLPELPVGGVKESRAVFRRRFSLLLLIYVLIGLYVAFVRDYITVRLIKGVLSALLAIFLWFLVLLGVDLHIR